MRKNRVLLFFLSVFLFSAGERVCAQNTTESKTSFKAQLINIEATGKDVFRFNTTLHNGEKQEKIFQLLSRAPEGWITTFQTGGSQVTSVKVDSEKTQNITVELRASPFATPRHYKIPILAVTSEGDSLILNLEAVIKGDYNVELTTPDGRLSDEVTEGKSKPVKLKVRNTGTLPLDGLELSAQAPNKWSATFQPSKIERLEPGKESDVTLTIDVPDKTIAGDYISNLTVKNNFATATATIRFTVTTSLLTGWVGMLIILVAVGIVYYLIRKYGRR